MEENTKKTQEQTENVIGKENKIVTGSSGSSCSCSFPYFVRDLFQQLYNAADAVIVGALCRKRSFVGGRWRHRYADAAAGGIFRWIVQRCHSHYLSVLWGKTCRDGRLCRTYLHCVQPGSGSRHDDAGITAAPWALRAMSTPEGDFGTVDNLYRIYFLGVIGNLIQHGRRYPAGCGGFQETAVFPDCQLPDQYCAGHCVCHRTAYGCGRCRTCYDTVAGTQRCAGIVGADADEDMHRLELKRSVLMEECSTGSSGSDFRRDCSR